MREKTCCFTGHRIIEKTEYSAIKKHLEDEIEKLIKQGVIYFGAGGAIGFDMLAAETVIKLRVKYPQIKLILVFPCEGQTSRWNKADTMRYEQIKLYADKIKILSPIYYEGCMHVRNRHLVNNSSYCICYLRKISGGTAYTVKYALENGLTVIHL